MRAIIKAKVAKLRGSGHVKAASYLATWKAGLTFLGFLAASAWHWDDVIPETGWDDMRALIRWLRVILVSTALFVWASEAWFKRRHWARGFDD